MSKNLRLLLKNSFKTFFKYKWQTLQLTLLSLVGVAAISTSALSDLSLRTSLNYTKNESGSPDLTFSNLDSIDKINFNITDSSGNIIDKDYDFNYYKNSIVQKSTNPFYVYDPTSVKLINNIKYYGFSSEYINNKTTKDQWPNIIYNDNNKSQSIITKTDKDNPVSTPLTYKGHLADFYSFYNDIISPTEEIINHNGIKTLYNTSLYKYNPWQLFIDNTTLNSSTLGLFYISNANGFNNDNYFELNHAIVNKDNMQALGSDSVMNNTPLNMSDVVLNSKSQLIANDIAQPFRTNLITNNTEFTDFINKKNDILSANQSYPKTYYEYANSIINDLLSKNQTDQSLYNNFSKSYGWINIKFNYDLNESNGFIKTLVWIYETPEADLPADLLPFKKFVNKPEIVSLLSGTGRIPLIPFITIQPNYDIKNLNDYIKYKNNPDIWLKNSKLNNQVIYKNLMSSLNLLSEKIKSVLYDGLRVFSSLNKPEFNKLLNYYDANDTIWAKFAKNNFNAAVSKNYTINTSNINAIATTTKNIIGDKTNNIVLKEGIQLPKDNFTNFLNLSDKGTRTASLWERFDLLTKLPYDDSNIAEVGHKIYNDPFFTLFRVIYKNMEIFAPDDILKDILTYTQPLLIPEPTTVAGWKEYFKVINDWRGHIGFNDVRWTGCGYSMNLSYKNKLNQFLEYTVEFSDPSSYFTILSQNYIQNNSDKVKILESIKYDPVLKKDINVVNKATKLPYFSYDTNIHQNEENRLYNYNTNQFEYFNDFTSWMRKAVPSQNKITISGTDFIIIGSGINNEFLYPITSANQILVDNNTPVCYFTDNGFFKSIGIQSTNYQTNYWLDSKGITNNYWTAKEILQQYSPQTTDLYSVKDPSQPNKLLYTRINFPSKILNIVLVILVIICSIIGILTITFLIVLIKSIIMQNINTFAVLISNGYNKHKIAASYFFFGIFPAIISALIGYVISLFIYPIISLSIKDYWILDYTTISFNILIPILIFLIVGTLLFLTTYIVIIVITSKNVRELLGETVEYKFNLFNKWFSKRKIKYNSISSFRISYLLSNIGKIFTLLLIMTAFVSITTVSFSVNNVFKTATTKTDNNKQYSLAIDLYSPTEQGGFYYNIPYNKIGMQSQGLIELLPDSTYGENYKSTLTQTLDNNETITYNNLFLPSSSLTTQVVHNIQFLRNKIFYLPATNINVKTIAVSINPWLWTKKILPNEIVSNIETAFNKQMGLYFDYLVSKSKTEDPAANKMSWTYTNQFYSTINSKPSLSPTQRLYDSTHDANGNWIDPSKWDQTNWLFKYSKNDNSWSANDNTGVYAFNSGLTIKITQSGVQLLTNLISSNYKKDYKDFIKRKYPILIDNNYNYFLGLNVVPFNDGDETYSYLKGLFMNQDKIPTDEEIKITGIKPDSTKIKLWNEYDNIDLKTKLLDYEKLTTKPDYYPLVINEVVSKKYSIHENDILEFRVDNKLDRFTNKANNIPNDILYKFKVIGITTSKSEKQYFTLQSVANTILGYDDKITYSQKPNKYDPFNWKAENVSYPSGSNYVPFNGVFTSSKNVDLITNFCSIYSFSGLSPLSYQLPTNMNGDTFLQIKNSYDEINKILHIANFTQPLDPKLDREGVKQVIEEFVFKYTNLFDSNKYFTSSIQNADAKVATSILGTYLDKTVNNVTVISIIALIPTLILIISLLSYTIVNESKRLISLLKVLGYGNKSNAFSLALIFFVCVPISLGLGILISYGMLSLLTSNILFSLNILINPIISWIGITVSIGVLLLLSTLITLGLFINLKRLNVPNEINLRQ